MRRASLSSSSLLGRTSLRTRCWPLGPAAAVGFMGNHPSSLESEGGNFKKGYRAPKTTQTHLSVPLLFLGVDSNYPFFPNHRSFQKPDQLSLGLRRFSRKIRIPGRMGKVPLDPWLSPTILEADKRVFLLGKPPVHFHVWWKEGASVQIRNHRERVEIGAPMGKTSSCKPIRRGCQRLPMAKCRPR